MEKLRTCIAFLLIGIVTLNITACEGNRETEGHISKVEESIRVIDCEGREVEIEKEAKKIVDLTTLDGVRTLIQLGAQDRLVGISNQSHQIFNLEGTFKKNYIIVSKAAPELKDLIVVGNIKEPNIEMIMSLKPDVIFIDSFAKHYAEGLQNQTNIPVVCVGSYGSFSYEIFNVIGKIVGKQERVKELIRFTEDKIKPVKDITEKLSDNERKRLFYWSHPIPGNAPKTNATYEAFDLAGGRNVAVQERTPKGVYEVTKEQIVAWDPEFIFLHSPFKDDFKGWISVDDLKKDKVIQGTQALIKNNIYAIKGEFGGWDIATEAIEVLYVAKILYPEKFQGMDIEKKGNEILKEFYGIDGLYTDMSKAIKLYQWK